MNIPVPTLPIEYDDLRQAAETFGFHREASLIDQKGSNPEKLFTLLVTGPPQAGKSSIINLLLQRSIMKGGSDVTWLNIFRRARSDKEFAELFINNDSGRQIKIKTTVQQAMALLENRHTTSNLERSRIERIVWHIQTQSIPQAVELAEPPNTLTPARLEPYFWESDGVLFIVNARELDKDATGAYLDALKEASNKLPVATLGVLTHMDRYPQKRWLQVLQEARATIGKHLDAIVPCSSVQEELEYEPRDSNAMFLREVRYRFFASATTLIEKNQVHFARAMREGLAQRFEEYVDAVLHNKWSYHQFRSEVKAELQTMKDTLERKIHHFVDEQQNLNLARAATLDGLEHNTLADNKRQGNGSSQLFGTEIYQYITKNTQRLFSSLRFETTHITRLKLDPTDALPSPSNRSQDVAQPISFKLPDIPLGKAALLCGDKGDPETLASILDTHNDPRQEARLYGQSGLQPGTSMPADEWVTATEWVPLLAQQAREDLEEWLNRSLGMLQQSLFQSAEHTFRAIHGFLPNETAVVLMPLEDTYAQLIDTPLRLPTPHLPGENLSPVLFLCRMQEAEFVDIWNKQLIRRCFDYVVPAIRRRLLQDIEEARRQLKAQWRGSKDSIQKRVEITWKRYGRRLAMKSAVRWSIPWVSALMRDRLMDPVQYLSRSRVHVQAPYDYPVSLFLHKNSDDFLTATNKPQQKPLTPDQFIADLLQSRLQDSAGDIWQNKESILVAQPLHNIIRRRTTLALGLMFCFSLIWIMLFGTSSVSMGALASIVIPFIGLTAYLIKRLIDKGYQSSGELQAERLYQQIQQTLDERLDYLKEHVVQSLNTDDLWEEVFHLLQAKQTAPTGCYMPYKELIQRLDTMYARAEHRTS